MSHETLQVLLYTVYDKIKKLVGIFGAVLIIGQPAKINAFLSMTNKILKKTMRNFYEE